MKLKAVFFDLDGTLLDTANDLCGALNSILKEDQQPELSIEEGRQYVSHGSKALVMQGYKLQENDPALAPLRQRLLEHYEKNLATHTRPFSGIKELIEKLAERNIAWGVATNKPQQYAEPLMRHFDFASLPSCVLSPEHVTHPKPHRESLELACKLSQCELHEAIYIGDHKRDIDCGKNAGMPTIAVSYGYLEENEDIRSWNADHIVDSANELWPTIDTHYLN